jgi:hypothetical protein
MDGKAEKPIRISWNEWRDGRETKRKTLVRKGLATPYRRSTAKPRAIAARDAVNHHSVSAKPLR